jgi:hypothetical protein
MTMDDIDALQLDFLKSYDDDEREGLLPQFGGGLKAPLVVPEPVQSAKLEVTTSTKNPKRKRRSPKVPWKKPKDMPRRPLSAYNLFFQRERERLVKKVKLEKAASDVGPKAEAPIAESVISSDVNDKTASNEQVKNNKKEKGGRPHIKSTGIGFANLAKTIAAKWKQIDPETRIEFEKLAAADKERYNKEMVTWRGKKKVEQQLNEKAQSLDAERLLASGPSSLPRQTFMRRLSDPYPDTSHYFELYHHRQQYMFSSSFTRACLAQMMQGSSALEPFMEPSMEPLMEPLSVPSLHSIDHELENTFQEEPTDALRAFSDSFLDNHIYDVRPHEELATDVPMTCEQKLLPGLGAQTSLKALGSMLDDDTVDFLTHVKFEH